VEEVQGEVEWSSTQTAIATVVGAGLVSAHDEGEAVITASLHGINAALELSVGPAVVVRVTPTFVGGRMIVGQATTLKVYGVMSDGAQVNLSAFARVTHGPGLFTDVLGDRVELRAVSLGAAALLLEYAGLSHTVPVDVTQESITTVVLDDAIPAVFPGPTPVLTRFKALATWSDGAVSDVSELGSWWIDDSSVVELFDEPGRRGHWTLGRGGKAEIHFEHPSLGTWMTYHFELAP
jgi:hypothetical protein